MASSTSAFIFSNSSAVGGRLNDPSMAFRRTSLCPTKVATFGATLVCSMASKDFATFSVDPPQIANDDRGDSHPHEVFCSRHICHSIGMGVNINEPRRHDQSLCFNFCFGIAANSSDLCDTAILDAHVRKKSWISGAVDDAPVTDHHAIRLGMNRRATQKRERAKKTP